MVVWDTGRSTSSPPPKRKEPVSIVFVGRLLNSENNDKGEKMAKKILLIALSLIPFILGMVFVSLFIGTSSTRVTFNRSTNTITTIEKDFFGFTKKVTDQKLSLYEKAYLADPSAYYVNILPVQQKTERSSWLDHNGPVTITITGNWWGSKDLLKRYVDRINSFFNSGEEKLTITIPYTNPGRYEAFIFIMLALAAAISGVLIKTILSKK